MSKLEDPWKQDKKLGFCRLRGRYHCPADKRGGKDTPGWCVNCEEDWKEKK